MKRSILLIMIVALLTGCMYNKEARELKKNETVQQEIETAIKKQAKKDYGMDVDVKMDRLAFTFPEGKLLIPLKTDKRMKVPVEVIGDPSYTFKAYFPVYDEEEEVYAFQADQIDLKELPSMARDLLTNIYQALYQDELQEIKDFDSDVKISVRVEDKFSSRYFENKEEERALALNFAKDYEAGKFTEPGEYKHLIRRHAALPNEESNLFEDQLEGNEPCTPAVKLQIDHEQTEEQTQEERFEDLVEFIEDDQDLPNGTYAISIWEEDPEELYEREHHYESVLKCNH